ncbi:MULTISPECIES: peptidyl-prolyl cis-trans isomerase [unclassified Bartonella]|uniref:peptidyl-prolyl cis-trans isomerase n=1 Tax=unclassified Bartonella TaxID=2645622 RepID=UPI00099987E8|nr:MULTISPECIES: peptidyl-prolyl cis-trans isomerase [unclassified Bartonella]AQX27840.1 peptidyl-prolyl cis-trans isomerase D [Bartonella sp. JB15]AQX29120.1 peptidyl-prolyl cis-trans isomerase D [Bartonella sp. JB63]
MLETIRNAVNSWIAKIFLTVLLLCFILLWGLPQLHTINEKELLTSGKSAITVDTYRLALADQSLRLAITSHLGRMFTPDEIQRYKIPVFVLNQLQQDVLFDEQVRKMKINLSKDEIARIIGNDNIFHRDRIFNRDLFLNYLRQLHTNESNFFNYYTKKEKRNQLILASLSGMKAPDIFYKAFATYQEEKRIADYLVIDLKKEEKIADPNQEILEKWFDTHKEKFRAPEYRTVSLFSMTSEEFLKPQDISVNEIQTYYTQNASRFITPEKRTIEELRFSTREAADNAAKKIAGGLSFDVLVKEEKKTLSEITKGPLAENELPSHLASEIFELKKGQISAVINDLQGPVIIRVTHITPSTQIPLEKVENDIRQILAQNHAKTYIRNKYIEIENARLEGTSLTELAKQHKLSLRKITIDKTGKTTEGITLTDLPQKDVLLNAIYQSREDIDMDPLSLPEGGYLWYQVDMIIPARDRILSEVKQNAIVQWKEEEIQRFLDEKAQDVLKQLAKGKSLDSLATELSITKKTTPALRRQDSSKVLGIEGIKALFHGAKDHYGVVKGADTTNRIVYKITTLIIPEDITAHTLLSDVRTNIDMMIREDLKLEMLQVANKEHPIEINNLNYSRIFSTFQ